MSHSVPSVSVSLEGILSLIASMRSTMTSASNAELLDILDKDLTIMSTYLSDIQEFDVVEPSGDAVVMVITNDEIEKFDRAVKVIQACISQISIRIKPKSTRDAWSAVITQWYLISGLIITYIASVSVRRFDIAISIIHLAKYRMNPLDDTNDTYTIIMSERINDLFPVFKYKDLSNLNDSLDITYNKIKDLSEYVLNNLYTGDGFDESTANWEAYVDRGVILANVAQASGSLIDKPDVKQGTELMNPLWAIEDNYGNPSLKNLVQIVDTLNDALDKYSEIAGMFESIAEKYSEYAGTPNKRYTSELRDNDSESFLMLDDLIKTRDDTFEKYHKWFIGIARTFCELARHVRDKSATLMVTFQCGSKIVSTVRVAPGVTVGQVKPATDPTEVVVDGNIYPFKNWDKADNYVINSDLTVNARYEEHE